MIPSPRSERSRQGLRVGVDIGGTFTDIVVAGPEGVLGTCKLSSSPDDYAHAIARGLAQILGELGLDGAVLEAVVHGTTVATNAVLQRSGARTGLITTAGFRDVLEIRRLRQPLVYELFWEKPLPLVPRYLRLEVPERVMADGSALRPLDEAAVARVADQLVAEGVESIAVCLLHAYANPAHEQAVGAVLRANHPGIAISLSSDVLPEPREYERTSTTVVNAYLMPVMRSYLDSLQRQLGELGVEGPLLLMQSSGGVTSARFAQEQPVHILESGPAAGVVAAAGLARVMGCPNLVAFDMGGTTAKAAIVESGAVHHSGEIEVGSAISLTSRLMRGGGYVVRSRVVDMAEVGAGGGSIVWLDSAGAVHVGPQSAGSSPGPVCYATGGTAPTVTDANLVLGYINPSAIAGGAVSLNLAAAQRALTEQVATPLGLDLDSAAYGVHRIATANMMGAVRAVSTERGRDVRRFSLFAFGGSGPIHAVAIARELEISQVVVPPSPGLFSAVGLLLADVERDAVHSFVQRLDGLTEAALYLPLEGLRRRVLDWFATEGYTADEVSLQELAYLRYAGQSYELDVAVAPGAPLSDLAEHFGSEHERTYGHRMAGGVIELVSLRVVGRHHPPGRRPEALLRHTSRVEAAPGERLAYFGPHYGRRSAPVLRRSDLDATPRAGPLLIDEYDATTVVPPGCRARLDEWGNILIDVGGGAEA